MELLISKSATLAFFSLPLVLDGYLLSLSHTPPGDKNALVFDKIE